LIFFKNKAYLTKARKTGTATIPKEAKMTVSGEEEVGGD